MVFLIQNFGIKKDAPLDWLESDFGPTARMNFFRYKFLGFEPRDEKELEQFKAMEAFQQEYNGKQNELKFLCE